MGKDEKELAKIYRVRVRDRMKYKSRRQKSIEANPPRMDELVSTFFKKDTDAIKKIDENRGLLAWPDFVGEAAARVSQAVRIRGNQLIVVVKDPLWMQQLLLLKNELLKRYRREFPALRLRDIFFTRNQH